MKSVNLCLPVNVKRKGHILSAEFTEPKVLDSRKRIGDAPVASRKSIQPASPKISKGFVT